MKKSNKHFRVHICFQKVHICDAKIASLDDKANLEILPHGLHFSEVMSFTKLSKILMGNIYNWLLKGNGAITRMLAYCNMLAR